MMMVVVLSFPFPGILGTYLIGMMNLRFDVVLEQDEK